MKANDSRECRNCHEFQAMDFTRQSKRGADAHSAQLAAKQSETGKTCIDCHKGIAHRLPDMTAQ
jgi:cytochrome c-type protein NapC